MRRVRRTRQDRADTIINTEDTEDAEKKYLLLGVLCDLCVADLARHPVVRQGLNT